MEQEETASVDSDEGEGGVPSNERGGECEGESGGVLEDSSTEASVAVERLGVAEAGLAAMPTADEEASPELWESG